MKKLFFLLVLGTSIGLVAQDKDGGQSYPNETLERLQDKNFYLFTAMKDDHKVREVLKNDKTLASIFNTRFIEKQGSAKSLNGEELIRPFLWKNEDIAIIGKRLVQLSQENKAMAGLIQNLRESHSYANFEGYSDEEFLRKSWELCAKGMDTILEVYGLGKKPLYPKIDSVAYDAQAKQYVYGLTILKDMVLGSLQENTLFFQPSLDLTLWLLYSNHRDEAVRYEPLEQKENAKAFSAVSSTDFDDYDYGCLVVLGSGPETTRDRLSGMAKIRLQLAVKAYKKYNVPFIIVSGGHAHPFMTPYNEGVEMKKELMAVYGIPEEHIIIEPYARHTTTNMRNATRLMTDYGIPLQKKSLVITGPMHSSYVESDGFTNRCSRELGYQPIELFERLSPLVLEFKGLPVSLHQNPYQPLDP